MKELSHLNQGNSAFRRGDFHQALAYFNKAVGEISDPTLKKIIEFNIELARKKLELVNHTLARVYEGRLERFNDGLLRGWVVNRNKPEDIFDVGIYVNGNFYTNTSNNKSRKDLHKAGKSAGLGGFLVDIDYSVLIQEKNHITLVSQNGQELASIDVPKLLDAIPRQAILKSKNCEPQLPLSNLYEGKLEGFNNGILKGWAVNKNNPGEVFGLSVFVDGVFFNNIQNDQVRNDLRQKNKSLVRGGINFGFPQQFLDNSEKEIRITYPNGEVFYQDIHKGCDYNNPEDIVLIPVNEPLCIIVPVYNAADDVKICIERLGKYTPRGVEVMFINDASTDSNIERILKLAEEQYGFTVFHNEKNLGFTKTVNRGIKLANDKDVILLNSDARVTPRWVEGFRRALATDSKIATVTAMSDRAGAFSAPNIGNDNNFGDIKEEDYAIAFRRRSRGLYPTVPTGNGFCMYIRRQCINEIGILDEQAFPRGYGEENDFCMRARNAGWRNIIDDRTYVFHDRSKSFGSQKTDLINKGRAIIDERYPDYKKAISIFRDSPLINLARFSARQAVNDCQKTVLPRGLFVISTLTGGTPQTNRDLMNSLFDRIEGWLLHCDRKIISLYKVSRGQDDQLIKQHILQEQVDPLTHYCAEYDRVILNWLYQFDFEFVHIRHLAWHSLSLPRLAKEAGAKVINSFHDFYTVCPTVKLLDGDNVFCGGVCTKGRQCKPDLWGVDSLPPLQDAWVHQWRAKFKKALSYCDVFITTHKSARQTIIEHLDIPEDKFFVIPHGRDFNQYHQLAEPYNKGDVLKILVPGNISVPKGSRIIEELLKLDVKGKLHFHILGRSNIKFKHPRLTFHGEYKRDDFAEHVKAIRPHIGAVFSIWNETWCHTLTELWSVGLPVLVTDFDTLADRVRSHGGGWVLKNNKSYYDQILELTSDAASIQEEKICVLKCQNSMTNAGQMSKMYYERYFAI